MKKVIIMLLCLLCLVPTAKAELLTLTELKQQTPDRLRLTVTTGEGRIISVDAPIELPEEDTLPILLCKQASFDTSTLREKYPKDKSASKIERIADAAWNYKGSPFISYNTGTYDVLFGKTDYSTRPWLSAYETPPENDLTLEQVMALVYSRIVEFGGDADADVRPYSIAARGGLYRMKTTRVTDTESGLSYKMLGIDPDKPIKNSPKGTWTMHLAQYIHGAQIFPDGYFPEEKSYTDFVVWPQPAIGHIDIMDENVMNFGLSLLSPQQVLVENAPLLSFPEIQNALAQRIQSGQLISVYRLTLGYSVMLAEGDMTQDEQGDPSMTARYVLVPAWQIRGYDLKDRTRRSMQGYSEPEEQAVLQNQYGSFELRFDATTAKPLNRLEYALE